MVDDGRFRIMESVAKEPLLRVIICFKKSEESDKIDLCGVLGMKVNQHNYSVL